MCSKAVCTSFTVIKANEGVCVQDQSGKQNVRVCIYVYRCQISFTVGICREFCQVGARLLLDSSFHRNYPPRNILTLTLHI